jgi:peptidoglycan/xylan/chitin deacetylase (PgdA/CDA1 family)
MKRYLAPLFKNAMFFKDSFLGFRTNRLSHICGMILQYHSVSPKDRIDSYVNSTLSLDPATFDRQMSFITRHYQVVTIDEIIQCPGKRDNERRPMVAITFDDGYRDNYLYAYPILKKYKLPATFYLTVDCIKERASLWTATLNYLVTRSKRTHLEVASLGKVYPIGTEAQKLESAKDIKSFILSMSRKQREQTLLEIRLASKTDHGEHDDDLMLNIEEVKEMGRNGMNFGSHTLSHPSLPYVPKEEARIEISKSKKVLENELGEPVIHFSYPNPGDKVNFNSEIREMVKDAGYVSAVTSIDGYVEYCCDPFELRRKGIYRKFGSLPNFYFWIEKEGVIRGLERFGLPCRKVSGPRPVSRSL